MKFAEKLAKLRKEKGLSQEALAEYLGVSRQSVSKWERGLTYPETEKLIAISELFYLSLDELLKEGEIKAIEEEIRVPEVKPKASRRWSMRKRLGIWALTFSMGILCWVLSETIMG